MAQFTRFFMHAAYGHDSVLFRLCCDMLRTSGFVDDVMFAHMVRHVYS